MTSQQNLRGQNIPDKDKPALVVLSEDKPLIHYGLIRLETVVVQQYTQIIEGNKLFITVIFKHSPTGRKTHKKFTFPKREDFWGKIQSIFNINLAIANLETPLKEKLQTIIEKDFRMSSWDDILDFFTSNEEFDSWVEEV